jgi:aspartate carbamoyltransferase catalytic subunit
MEIAAQGRSLDGMSIALIGDLRFGRAVHSLCRLLCLYSNIRLHLISPPELSLPDEELDVLRTAGHKVESFQDLSAGIQDVDILYVTRTQEERFPSQLQADRYRGLFRLNQSIYTQNCAPNTVIMHPLPRDSRAQAQELDEDLNQNPNLAIFRQTDNGVLIRMALFALVLDIVEDIDNHSRPVTWFTAKRHLPV